VSQGRVLLDVNNPVFLADFVRLPVDDLRQTVKTLGKLLGITWDQVYADHGLRWEAIRDDPGSYSLRISRKCRAVVLREGDYMRFLSIHPDHDSAYGRK
jgi:hypothetical protein